MSFMDETDFDASDHGKYKHPEIAGDYSYEELEEAVFAALDDDKGKGDGCGVRTLPRIKSHAGLLPGFDLSPVIDGMEIDKKIRRESNGNITAFFRYNQKLKRFWLNGDGTVGAEFDEKYVPRKPAGADEASENFGQPDPKVVIDAAELEERAATMQDSRAIARSFGVPNAVRFNKLVRASQDLTEAFDRGRQRFARKNNPQAFTDNSESSPIPANNLFGGGSNKGETGAMYIDIDVDEMEAAATEHGTKKAVAAALGIGYSTLYAKLDAQPLLQRAFERGYERHWAAKMKNEKPETEPETEEETMSAATSSAKGSGTRTHSRKRIDLDPAKVEEAARSHSAKSAIADALGIGAATLDRRLEDDPDAKAAFDRGRAARKLAGNGPAPDAHNSRTSDQDPHISQKPPPAKKPRGPHKTRKGKPKPPKAAAETEAPEGEQITAERTRELSEFADDIADADGLTEALAGEDEGEPAAHSGADESEMIVPGRTVTEHLDAIREVAAQPRFSITAQRIDSVTHVTFNGGSQLMVAFDGNFFTLPPEDREFLRHITDLMQSYNGGLNAPAKVAEASPTFWQRIKELFT